MCESKPYLTVYTNPGCVQCDATKKFLNERNTRYEVIDLSTDELALAAVKDLGYRKAPVIFARYPSGSESHWSGFNPGKLMGFIRTAKRWGDDS